jgi:signal transduction histidine kinase
VETAAIVVVLTCIANFFLGLFVLLRNPKVKIGQSFFAMVIFISAWAVSNYYTDNSQYLELNILFNRLAYLFSFLALVMSAVFTHYFLGHKKKYTKNILFGLGVGLLIMASLSLTDYVAGNVSNVDGVLHFKNGSLIFIYFFILLSILVYIIRNLYISIKDGTPLQRSQGNIIIASFTGCILLGMMTNLVVPVVTKSYQGAKFGPPLLTLILTTCITYAILTKKLFDIRLVVARSVGYFLLLAGISAAFFLGAFAFGGLFFGKSSQSGAQQVYDIILAVVLAYTFQPLRRFFQTITDKIFYRIAYDPNTLLSNLGTIMAREIELGRLTGDVIFELLSQMKLSKAVIVVLDDDRVYYEANKESIGNKEIDLIELKQIGNGVVLRDSSDSEEIKRIFDKYDLDISVDLNSSNELVGYLLLGSKMSGDIFNGTDVKTLNILSHELAIAIHNAKSYTQIQNFNKTLQKRVDEATEQLRDANEHLKELDQLKNEFLSMATHQLNTPLTVVDGYLTLINDGVVIEPTERKDYLEKTLERVRGMKRMVADFLNVSRIEAGKFIIDVKPTDINKMISEEVNGLGPSAKEKEVLLQFIPPKHPAPLVEVDEQKTRQAAMNLIDNAIYYAPKGEVKVYLDSDEDHVTLKVIDNGIGVPEKQKDKLFQKFYRADNARNERPNGNGVGLYLVKRVIEDQGGKIIFESSEGKGSTFGFTLPIKATITQETKPQSKKKLQK